MPDDVPAPAAHGLCSLHQAVVDFAQADLGNPREERRGGNGQWHHCRPHAIRGTHYQAGEGDQRDHQDQERDRAEQVDEGAQHAIKQRCFEDATLVTGDQQHRHRHPYQQGDQR